MLDHCGPSGYAQHLASYIRDPSKIRALTLLEYDRAPSVEQCQAFRRKHETQYVKGAGREAKIDLFRCGHTRDYSNVRTDCNGRESCVTCHAAAQDKSERTRRIREAKAPFEIVLPTVKTLPRFPGELIGLVARSFGLTVEQMLSPARVRQLVAARSVVAKVLHERGYSYPRISKLLGKSCHSSAINMVRTFDARATRFPDMARVYEALPK